MIRKLAVLLFAAAALLTGTTAAAAAPAGSGSGATAVQQRVDAVLAGIPGGRQVSPTRVEYAGLTVTVDAGSRALTCGFGHLCMTVRGTNFDFFRCQLWNLSGWTGSGPFINNQTPGTRARFYGASGNELWSSVAYESGNANWDPVWSLRPC